MWLLTRKFQARKQSVSLKYLDFQKENHPLAGVYKADEKLSLFLR